MSYQPPGSDKPSLFSMIGSALSAAFGVQSEQKRRRDFQHGSPTLFVLVGIAMTVALVLAIYLVVRLVLSASAG
ncbi:DUF2970 domain-containing protein [Methylotetracoccus oryzae]|uniref:DUF2970 domain-containing protein n=1 Tax=Methylotetracoccus oryzae TaxID=1919059 RepID=UPI001F21DD4B|nr:DUF2970 domain-containing protein [Methylotetracoccus oryzae]